jgi:hypothetical protein
MTVLEPCFSGAFMDDVRSNEEGGQGRAKLSSMRNGWIIFTSGSRHRSSSMIPKG